MTFGRYSNLPSHGVGGGAGKGSPTLVSGSFTGVGIGVHDANAPTVAATGNRKISVLGFKIQRKHCVSLLAFLAALALLGPDLDPSSMSPFRKTVYATICIHNIYIPDIDAGMLMPPVPAITTSGYMPTHIQMCYEWLRRDAITTDWISEKVSLTEHRDICLDWTAPHYTMMEIVSSSIMNTILPRIKYRHNCPHHREYEEALRGYDWSTFQTVFQEPAMAVDQNLVDPFLFEEQCKYCLATYSEAADRARIRSRTLHHCFAFPKESTLYVGEINLSPVSSPTPVAGLPSQPLTAGNIAPISSMTRPLRTRLLHSAFEWVNVTDHPPQENDSGTVIVIDSGSYGIEPSVYEQFIDPATTSIAILAGPLCYTANLPTGQHCQQYGEDLKAFLASRPQFSGLNNPPSGFQGRPGVDFQLSGSTAGIWSRAMLADNLLCPPNTHSCLFPAMGKALPHTSKLLESNVIPPQNARRLSQQGDRRLAENIPMYPAAKFVDKVGSNDNIEVIQLPDGNVPTIVEGTPAAPPPAPIPAPQPGVPVSPSFAQAALPVTGDGYSPDTNVPAPAPVNLQEIAAQDSATAIEAAAAQLPPELTEAAATTDPDAVSPLTALDNVAEDPTGTEVVPTQEEVDAAIAAGEPLDLNTNDIVTIDEATGEVIVPDPELSTELANDESSPLATAPLTEHNYMDMAVERRDSKERIVTGIDGNYLFEVPCPEEDGELTDDVIIIEDGYVMTNSPTAGRVVISDGTGTVTMESPVTVTTVPVNTGEVTTIDPVTGDETTEVTDYVTIHDPILDEDVNVTCAGIMTNPDSSLTVDNTVGSLVVDPNTQSGVLITGGSSETLDGDESTPATVTIIEGTVESTGNENIPPTEGGTLVMYKEPEEPEVIAEPEGYVDPLFNTNPAACEQKDADICIAIDNSGSICYTSPNTCTSCGSSSCQAGGLESSPSCCGNYKKVQDFATSLITQTTTLGGNQQFSIVNWATLAQTVAPLSSSTDAINAVLNTEYTGGWTNTEKAIRDCQATLQNSSNDRKVIVLISDGAPSACGDSGQSGSTCPCASGGCRDNAAHLATRRAESFKELGTTIIPVGITTQETNLDYLFSLGSKNVPQVLADSLDDLPSLQQTLVDLIGCSEGGTRAQGGTHEMGGGYAVAGATDEETFGGFLDTDPNIRNSGSYHQYSVSPLESEISGVDMNNCILKPTDIDNPIYIHERDGNTVTFDTYQTFKGSAISWVAVDIADANHNGFQTCIKVNEVPTGKSTNVQINDSSDDEGGYPRRTAQCTNGQAIVDIFIHDGSTGIGQVGDTRRNAPNDITSQIPSDCEPSRDKGNKCWFRYTLNCGQARRRLQQQELSQQPMQQKAIQQQPQHQQHQPMQPQTPRTMMTPQNVQLQQAPKPNIKFARDILEKCPQLGRPRVFDHFQFGGPPPESKGVGSSGKPSLLERVTGIGARATKTQ